MLKKLMLSAAIAFSLTMLHSCSEGEFNFFYDLEEYPFCFEASAFVAAQEFDYTVTQADLQTVFTAAGATISDVENAELESLTVEVTDSAKNLNEISGMQVYVREVGATAHGEQIAYVGDIADNAVSVNFSMNGTELKDWLAKDSFEVHIVVFNEENNTDEVCLKLTQGRISITAAE